VTLTCDTSALVPALVAWHPDHDSTRSALEGLEAVPAHVVVETFSVLTRLPTPSRFSAADAGALVGAIALPVLGLPPDEHLRLVDELARGGIRGGSTYDALVAATARHHGAELITRDRRARPTYDALGVRYRLAP
jgi:predicted nucleic acid-binding protein